MLKEVPIEEVKSVITDADVEHEAESGYYVLTSKNAVKTGVAGYPLTLIPDRLPVNGRGGFIVPGSVGCVGIPRFYSELGVLPCFARFEVRTGRFIQVENQSPRLLIQHPGEAEHFVLHVLWNPTAKPPVGGMDSDFAKHHGAIWYRRFDNLSDSEGEPYGNEDVWVLPATGFVKALCYSLAATAQQEIDAGDTAEREFQAHKAEYRAELEQSDLLERFCKAYGPDGITRELKEDHVEITAPSGVDRIRYDAKCLPIIRESVEDAERLDALKASGLLDAMADIFAFRAIIGLLF